MAGVVFQTSHDHYTTILQRYTSTILGGTASIGAFGRNGTNGLRIAAGTGGAGALTFAHRTLPTTLSTIYHGFAFRTSALPDATNSRIIAQFLDAGNVQVSLVLMSDATLRVYKSTTTSLGTVSGFSMLVNTFYHLSWKITISATVGVVQVWVNEVSGLNLTNQDTKGFASSSVASEFRIGSQHGAITGFAGADSSGKNNDFDDVVVRDDSQVLDYQVRSFLPTGTGATNQWTATGAATTREAVDEAAPNSDTDYASTTVVNDKSLFTYDTIPTTSTIVAVVPMPFAKKTDAGTAKIKSTVRLGGTNYPGAEKAPSDGSYEYHPDILMVSPATAVAFTPTEWNSPIEIGPERSA